MAVENRFKSPSHFVFEFLWGIKFHPKTARDIVRHFACKPLCIVITVYILEEYQRPQIACSGSIVFLFNDQSIGRSCPTPPISYDGKINVTTIDSIQTSVSRRIRLRWKILIDENGFSACCFDTSPGCFSVLFESFDHGAYENARTSFSFVHR
jgi:hypothetical protein